MTAFWATLVPFIAVAVIGVAAWIAIVGTNAVRRHDYHLFEDKSAPCLAEQFPLPEATSTTAEARRKSLSPILAKVHQQASAAQTTYHNAVVCSASCLVVAFLALAATTLTLLSGTEWWPAHFLLNCIDVAAVIAVLALFFYGRSVNRPWIASRTTTEFLRQYQYLAVVFPDALSAPSDEALKVQFAAEARRTETAVARGPTATIAARVGDFWAARRAGLAGNVPAEADLNGDALLLYLDKRVRRQLGWFTDSQERLEYISERRARALLILYALTVALGLTKLLLFLRGGGHHEYVLPLLLVVTGLSGAMTAYYINQNTRSLIHRYYTQQRVIKAWLETFNETWNFAALPAKAFGADEKALIRAEILKFEDVMIEELIDWIHITSHDAIELAP